MTTLNRLHLENSPYLLQHATNPVAWFPWGDEAFEKARHEDKPVLLSIGYSTCHWCHVMAHESFEDQEVADLLNEFFICIKVDREERPDIDQLYMTFCTMTTGSGGWPLTVLLTPDRQPFFAGTYFPRQSRFGRPGMLELLPRLHEIWITRRKEVLDSAISMVNSLHELEYNGKGGSLPESILDTCFQDRLTQFDQEYGGFGTAPKFPTPHTLLFLLHYWKRTGTTAALGMVEKTLTAISFGGINDHLGFGFHRYATDRGWRLPHFEKMLYDQAMLVLAFCEAYQATGQERFRATAANTCDFVLQQLRDSTGGFFSAVDADSEGEEGKYYLWTEKELLALLTGDEWKLVQQLYSIQPDGNFLDEASGKKNGANILTITAESTTLEHKLSIPPDEMAVTTEKIRTKLLAARQHRQPPGIDDKVLTDWNGLMIAALAQCAQMTGAPVYLDAARKATDFILEKLLDANGRLLHRWRAGNALIAGMVDDYAFLIWGLLDLYEACFEIRYLETAVRLQQQMLAQFWDDDTGGFFSTPVDGEQLLLRKKELYDGAIPSGNSVALHNLIRLARMTGDTALESKAETMADFFAALVVESPAAYTHFLAGIDLAWSTSREIVLTGDPSSPATAAIRQALQSVYQPNKVVLFKNSQDEPDRLTKIAPFTENMPASNEKTTIYICTGHACEYPTTDPTQLKRLLDD